MTVRALSAARKGLAKPSRMGLIPAPTPLIPTPALAKAIGGPQLWIKRDDLIPFGFGGNKIRGLDLILADAISAGADTLVTGAGPLSNHVRATAAAAAYAGLKMTAVYWGAARAELQGNHLLATLWGADIRFTGDDDRASVESGLAAEAERLSTLGRRPYVIPRGGACALGAIGHALAVREVLAQCRASETRPDVVVLAVGSGGTLAGWLLGSRLFAAPWRVEGVTVSRPAPEARTRVAALAAEAAAVLGKKSPLRPDDVLIHDGFIGEGYGKPSEAGRDALILAARAEGLLLDPTYTAKALAGYRALVAAGRFRGDRSALFLHTGGEPSVFVRPEAAR